MSDLATVRSMELNGGKSLFLAIVLNIVVASLIFILSRAVLISQDFVGSIYENGVPRALAGFSLLLFPYMHQRLEGKRHTRFLHLPDGAVPFEAYTLPWYLVLAYGILITFAVTGISLFLVWLIGLVTGFFMTRAISIVTSIILVITFYYFGFWAGTRHVQHPFLVAAGIVLGYTILEVLVSSALNIDSSLRVLLGLMLFLITSWVAALIGARAGKRRCLSNYVQFLLTPLAEQDRLTAVHNLYGEVKQRTSGTRELHDH